MSKLDHGTGCRGYAADAEKLVSRMALAGYEPTSIADIRAFAWQSGNGDLEWAAEIAWRSILRDRERATRATARRWVASNVADMRP